MFACLNQYLYAENKKEYVVYLMEFSFRIY